MSKSGELKMLKYGCSIDAPINYYHRSGDSEGSGGNMLDLYAQEASAEEAYLEEREESAREVFARAFKLYLKKMLTGKERKFLSRILSGLEKPQEVGRSMGVKWFEYMQGIQRKAFANAKAFGRVVRLSGWSRAELFAETIYKRLEQLSAGYALNEILPQNKKIERFRKKKAELARKWRAANYEHSRKYQSEYMKQWREDHREKLREWSRAYYTSNIERERARNRAKWEKVKATPELYERVRARSLAYYAEHAEEKREKNREYFSERREEINAGHRAHYEANKDRILAGRNTPEKREKHREYMKEYGKAHRAEEREYRRKRYAQVRERTQETARKWREKNRERVRELQREASKRYQAKKKAEREAAQALAGLLILSQTQGSETSDGVPAME